LPYNHQKTARLNYLAKAMHVRTLPQPLTLAKAGPPRWPRQLLAAALAQLQRLAVQHKTPKSLRREYIDCTKSGNITNYRLSTLMTRLLNQKFDNKTESAVDAVRRYNDVCLLSEWLCGYGDVGKVLLLLLEVSWIYCSVTEIDPYLLRATSCNGWFEVKIKLVGNADMK
jgi:hypothetical protein